MIWGQGELFAEASEQEIKQTEFYLKKFRDMTLFMKDFENYRAEMAQVAVDGEAARRIDQDDPHADKTANAVILTEKQIWVYGQYKKISAMLMQAYRLILDEEVKEVVALRFIQGLTRKETIMFLRRGEAASTVDRRITEGVRCIANSLKLTGFFDEIMKRF
ncbi:hypothetical protein [Paenibacillus massiliensis]|uniref:hypothetical protein n=1 Tax=Paenibacillus massiliensis TaxID=225917 RepID=UPI0004243E24|nr:hypothetical protein [Paenibacillus massiliensis]